MIQRSASVFERGYNVVPHVRVSMGKVTMLEMAYEWEGVKGTVPELTLDLSTDPSHEKVFLASVYRNSAGERRVVTDSKVVDLSVAPMARVADSADAILGSEGWVRLFMIFQVCVPPGLMGIVEEENTLVQVFEFTSRS